MTYPNAFAGVKKLFNANVLTLIAIILLVAGVIAFGFTSKIITTEGVDEAAVQAILDDPTSLTESSAAVFALPILIGCILLIIAFIMMLVGCAKAGKDEGAFKVAFWLMILAIIISVIISVVSKTEEGSPYSTIITTVFGIIAEIFIVKGVMNLAEKLNVPDMISRGKTLVTLFVILLIVSLALNVANIFIADETVSNVLTYVSYAATLFSVIVFFVNLGYLGKAKKMLANN